MARKRANLTDLLNDLTYKILYDKFKLISTNLFEWEGLPDGVQEKHIEKYLFNHGKAVFFHDPDHSFMCLECQDSGNVNFNGDPLGYIAHGIGYQRKLDVDDCIIIENNKLRLPTEPFIMHFVNKLAEAERTMDVNIKSCKTPVIFACDDKDVLTFKRIFQQVDGNVPAIFADKGLAIESIQAYQTGAKFLGNELMDYAQSVENKLLTFLGMNNPAVDKKERLITDEANSNNELIENFSQLQLEARERACEQINTEYGLNISVKKRVDNQQAVDNVVEEGVEDAISV